MKSKLFLKGFILVAILLPFFFFSCTKIKSTELGVDLLPAVDNVITFDTTLEVTTQNFLFADSTLPRVGVGLSGNLPTEVLGYISNDPQFGKTTGSIFIELRPPFYKYYFENKKDSLYLDSVVLCLKWSGNYGDTNALQKIDVFELDTQLKIDSSYRTNSSFTYSNLLGTRTLAPSVLNDSVFGFGQTTKDVLRIRLADEFGQLLLEQDSAVGEPYNRDSTFREFFKGFAIVPDVAGGGSGGNGLMGFSLSDTTTSLRLYYRYTKNGKLDTTYRSFTVSSNSGIANANRIERDRSGSQILDHLVEVPGGDSLVYIQSSPGSFATVAFPSLDSFKALKGNVIVHRAELSMQQVLTGGEMDNIFGGPPYLYIDYYDSVKKAQTPLLNDGFSSGQYFPSLLGGVRKYVQAGPGVYLSDYKFTITRHVQGIITRNEINYPLQLSSPFSVFYPSSFLVFGLNNLADGRVKLGGGNHSAQKMKLRIIYSKI